MQKNTENPCFSLSNQEVHVWQSRLDLPTATLWDLRRILSDDEISRSERYHFETDRNRFIAGRGILRKILGGYLNVEPGKLQLCYGKHGKPFLARTFRREKIHFNLSHSGGVGLYAFARNEKIGVDVEVVRNMDDFDQLGQQFFSAREYAAFRSIPDNKKQEGFFNCWTRKEAFIKAIGAGLSHPLDSFDVTLIPGEPARVLKIKEKRSKKSKWFMKHLNPLPNYTGAVVAAGDGFRCRFYKWIE